MIVFSSAYLNTFVHLNFCYLQCFSGLVDKSIDKKTVEGGHEYVQSTYSHDKCDNFEKIPSGRIERLQCVRYLFNNINTNGVLRSIQQE